MGKVPGDKFLVHGWEELTRSSPGTRNEEPGTFNRRGINLITALFILIALSAIGLLLYRLVLTQQESALRHLYSGEALYIAEAGTAWAIHNLEVDCTWGQPGEAVDCHEGAAAITSKPALCQVQLTNGTAYLSVTEQVGVPFDDADADGETCRKKTIESVGRRLGASGRLLAERRIRVTVD